MVSVRLYMTEHLVISAQKRQLRAVGDVLERAAHGRGAESPGELVARIALREHIAAQHHGGAA